jgi:hypothetical protein
VFRIGCSLFIEILRIGRKVDLQLYYIINTEYPELETTQIIKYNFSAICLIGFDSSNNLNLSVSLQI